MHSYRRQALLRYNNCSINYAPYTTLIPMTQRIFINGR
uniref:Uncharacterized protein n=1 Tax=Ascaris lumbricoides TaxID=6252 RepID=A0A0M3IBY1_ASCLU